MGMPTRAEKIMSNPLKDTVTSREIYEAAKNDGMKPSALSKLKGLLKELDTFPIMGSMKYKGPSKAGQAIANKIGRLTQDPANYR
jgi:hypothetical protein